MAKMIRGVTVKKYAQLMHDIEAGFTTEAELIKKKILRPSGRRDNRAINKHRDNKVFNKRSKSKGRRSKDSECLVPHCKGASSRRGLCNTHRTYAYQMIKLGKASESNLISRKLILSKASGGDQMSSFKKKKRSLKRHDKRALKQRSSSPFPEKLLVSDKCLFPKCKTSRKGGGRGLCIKHYSQYKRKKSKLSGTARKRLDRDLMKRRLLLPARARVIKASRRAESSAFEIGSTIRGSIRRW